MVREERRISVNTSVLIIRIEIYYLVCHFLVIRVVVGRGTVIHSHEHLQILAVGQS